MRRSYAALMALYPPEYRGLFADEMTAVFEQASRDRRNRGWSAYTLFLLIEMSGLVQGAALEWSRRSRQSTRPRVLTFAAGGMISLLFMGPLLHNRVFLPGAERLRWMDAFNDDETVELLVLAATSVVLIAAFSIAFVINLRSVAHRRQSKA